MCVLFNWICSSVFRSVFLFVFVWTVNGTQCCLLRQWSTRPFVYRCVRVALLDWAEPGQAVGPQKAAQQAARQAAQRKQACRPWELPDLAIYPLGYAGTGRRIAINQIFSLFMERNYQLKFFFRNFRDILNSIIWFHISKYFQTLYFTIFIF